MSLPLSLPLLLLLVPLLLAPLLLPLLLKFEELEVEEDDIGGSTLFLRVLLRGCDGLFLSGSNLFSFVVGGGTVVVVVVAFPLDFGFICEAGDGPGGKLCSFVLTLDCFVDGVRDADRADFVAG